MKNRLLLSLASLMVLSCAEPAKQTEKVEEEVPVEKIDHLEMGKEISAIAQAELMKSVKTALEAGGPAHAIEHCNIHATPLSDSLSEHFGVTIGRISMKNRNPDNAPETTQEKLLLNQYLESSLEGKTIKDTLLKQNDQIVYYRPIMIFAEACLKCHGQLKTDINDETLTALYKLYPSDKATNYRLGEFRGAWKISFN